MRRELKPHALAAVSGMRRYIILLTVPLVRGLSLIGDGWREWLSGAWIDLLALALVAALGFLRRGQIRLLLLPGGAELTRGLFTRETVRYFAPRTSVTEIRAPVLLKPLRCASVRISTSAPERSRLPLVLSYENAELLARQLSPRMRARCVYRPRAGRIAAVSAASSRLTAGLAFTAALLSNTAKVLGESFGERLYGTLSRIAGFFAVGLPPAVTIALLVLAAGWLTSLTRNFCAYYKLNVSRGRRALNVSSGLFVRSKVCIDADRITSLTVRSSLATQLLRRYSVLVTVHGYGGRIYLPVIAPACRKSELPERIRGLMPELYGFSVSVRPGRASLPRFILPPLLLALAVTAGMTVGIVLLRAFTSLVIFWALMIYAALAHLLAVKLIALPETGLGVCGENLCLEYEKNGVFRRVTVRRSAVAAMQVTQSIPQRRAGLCDVVIFERTGRRTAHRIRSVPRAEALNVLGELYAGEPEKNRENEK